MVTGGEYSLQKVAQYSLSGEVTYLADLQQGRHYHACTFFIDDNGVMVSLVVNIIKKSDNCYVVDTAGSRGKG